MIKQRLESNRMTSFLFRITISGLLTLLTGSYLFFCSSELTNSTIFCIILALLISASLSGSAIADIIQEKI